jgi:ribonuclease BN (tRNA processing enzyme)
MTDAEMVIRVHGGSYAYLSGYGSDAARDRYLRLDPYRQANTSCSVLLRERGTGRTLLHLAFDLGWGVGNALDAARDAGLPTIDALFVTHPHMDHVADLDRLAGGLRGSARAAGQDGYRLPLYCSRPCAARLLGEGGLFPWLVADARFAAVRHEPVEHCEAVVVRVPDGPTLTVTPVAVEHGPTAPGAVIYVVEAVGKKVVFGWDLLRLYEEGDDDRPSPAERERGVAVLPRRHAGLIRDADVLFLDSTSWNPRPSIGHLSIRERLGLARRWQARRLYWIHYGGSEWPDERPPRNPVLDLPGIDVRRALTDPELHRLAGAVSHTLAMDVRVAYAGLTLPDLEPWPDGDMFGFR